MDVFIIEVFIKKEYLVPNEISNGKNVIQSKAIGVRNKHSILNYILTKGIWVDEGKRIEKIFPTHCIERILVTKTSKVK